MAVQLMPAAELPLWGHGNGALVRDSHDVGARRLRGGHGRQMCVVAVPSVFGSAGLSFLGGLPDCRQVGKHTWRPCTAGGRYTRQLVADGGWNRPISGLQTARDNTARHTREWCRCEYTRG